ncbi:MAG: sarcosine oxidase subunit gamma [Hyphomicrobiaceae bacterium]
MNYSRAQTATWRPRSPLAGQHIVDTTDLDGTIGVALVEQPWRPTLLVMASAGQAQQAATTIAKIIDLPLPTRPARVANPHAAIVWSGPGQWLVMSEEEDAATHMIPGLAAALADLASYSEQTDARVILRLSGPGSRRTLMKLVGIDVHPQAFPVDAAAMTPVAHIPCHLWRLDDAAGHTVYEIAGPQSSAVSLWHAIVVAGSEFGLHARVAQPAVAK